MLKVALHRRDAEMTTVLIQSNLSRRWIQVDLGTLADRVRPWNKSVHLMIAGILVAIHVGNHFRGYHGVDDLVTQVVAQCVTAIGKTVHGPFGQLSLRFGGHEHVVRACLMKTS